MSDWRVLPIAGRELPEGREQSASQVRATCGADADVDDRAAIDVVFTTAVYLRDMRVYRRTKATVPGE